MPDFSVEAAGPRTIKVAVPSASRLATAGTILRCDKELLISGYLWKRFSLRAEGGTVQFYLHNPEYHDEHNCSSSGARTIRADITTEVERQGGVAAITRVHLFISGGYAGRNTYTLLGFMPSTQLPLLPNDTLSFSVTIDIIQPALTPPPPLAPPSGPPPDLTLTFSDGSPPLQVHRQMLQLASPVFGGLLSDLPGTNQLQLRERSHDMHLLLSFLYPALRPKPSLTLRGAAAVAALADKYDCAAAVLPHMSAVFGSRAYTFSDDPASSAYVMSWLQVGGAAGVGGSGGNRLLRAAWSTLFTRSKAPASWPAVPRHLLLLLHHALMISAIRHLSRSAPCAAAPLQVADKLGADELLERCIDFLDSNARKLAWGAAADEEQLAALSSRALAKLLVRAPAGRPGCG